MLLLGLLVIFNFSIITFADDVLVEVEQGTLRGHLVKTSVNLTYKAFQGIPFAQPPLGSLRFQAPQPPLSWTGIRDATKNSNSCYIVTADSPDESEDCLYLNVYTPVSSQENQTSFPVLIWIHGGGYTHGSLPGASYMINEDVIIVAVHYRLGPFGFLATGDTVIPGNAGHKDQAAAIKWIHNNIARFGGNPKKITISGGSAGGSSVGYQLLYKGNEGLFRAAILQSGSPLSPWSFMDNATAREYAFDLAKLIDGSVDFHNNTTKLRDFLLEVDSKEIDKVSAHTTITRPLPVIEPEHDGAFLTKEQYELLEAGDFIRVPIIIGTTSEEEISKAQNPDSLKKYLEKYESHPDTLIPKDFKVKDTKNPTVIGNTVKDLYFKNVPSDEQLGHVVRYMSHTSFTMCMIKHAELAYKYTNVFFYVFSYDGPVGGINVTIKGADNVGHGEESKYLWRHDDLSQYSKSDVLTIHRITRLWSNFIKYLNPTPTESKLLQNVTWPTVSSEYKYLDIGTDLEVKENPKSPYYNDWTKYYNKWAKRPFTTF